MEMKKLVQYADILTPNLTEACILTDTPNRESRTKRELDGMAEELSGQGPQKVVITGIPCGNYIGNYYYEAKGGSRILRTKRAGVPRSGTGDIFASILAADAVKLQIQFLPFLHVSRHFIRIIIKKEAVKPCMV